MELAETNAVKEDLLLIYGISENKKTAVYTIKKVGLRNWN